MNILPPSPVAGRPQSTANTIIAAGEHLVNVGRAGGTFAFRFFVGGFLKSIGQLPSLVILGAKLMLSVATLMPNIRHDYPGDWQAERSQSRRVLELLPLDTSLARV